ncbi:MBL fold metallo-hydrolase [Actinokineospora soli]|uniref:MBL fold metallo-hydrolase n=1 Tax=Actinokineospora soli TaxID=1048753 RepID=A0ABW2TWU6_9PSEU
MDLPRDSLHFVGNATTVLRVGPFRVLTDPNFLRRGQWAYLGYGMVSRRLRDPATTVDELPPLDAVLLSHMHGDHFDRVAARGLDKDLPVLTTRQASARLRRRGFREAVPLRTWSSTAFDKDGARLTVHAVPGRHGPGASAAVLPPVMGSVVEYEAPGAEPLRVYFSGDTIVHRELREIRERFPTIDLAVLHLGGTKILGLTVTMDARQGVDLLELLARGARCPSTTRSTG